MVSAALLSIRLTEPGRTPKYEHFLRRTSIFPYQLLVLWRLRDRRFNFKQNDDALNPDYRRLLTLA